MLFDSLKINSFLKRAAVIAVGVFTLFATDGVQAAEKFRILKEEGKMSGALAALAKKYDYYSARKDETDLRPLKDETISVVNMW